MLSMQGAALHAGANDCGQRGDGQTDGKQHAELHSVLAAAAVDIACGTSHAAAVLGSGAVVTWGANQHGEQTVPEAVEGIAAAERVFAGASCTFILTRGGEIAACGYNSFGQLCLGNAGFDVHRPQRVEALCGRRVAQLQGGAQHCILLEADGSALVWGRIGGLLADGSARWSEDRGCVPLRLEVGPALCLAAGYEFSAAVRAADGALLLWGEGFGDEPTPVPLPGGVPAAAVACGDIVVACSAEGEWSACGPSDCGLPFAVGERQSELRALAGGELPARCVPLCGPPSEFTLYLQGGGAEEIVRRSVGLKCFTGAEREEVCRRWAAVQRRALLTKAACAAAAACALAAAVAQRELLEAAYAAALCVAVGDDLLRAAARYERLQHLSRALLGLRCTANLLLHSVGAAASPASPPPSGSAAGSPQGDPDAELEPDGAATGGAQVRQADGLEAQQPAATGVLTAFSDRAKREADAAYPPAPPLPGMWQGMLVQVAEDDSKFELTPPTGLPFGAVAKEHWRRPVTGREHPELDLAVVLDDGKPAAFPFKHLRHAPAPQILLWVQEFPGRWTQEFDSDAFRPEDIACPPQWEHRSRRPAGKAAFCCLQRSAAFVAGRMREQLECGTAQWINGMTSYTAAWGRRALQEGVAAAHIFSLELINPRSKRPRKTQMYAVLSAAMRKNWDEQMREDTEAAVQLRLFAPLIFHLGAFTRGMAQEVNHVVVYRGIGAIVAQAYQAGTDFVWGCFSSTAETPKVAESFSAGVGTLFVLRERRAAPIAACSMFPSEAERVLPPTQFRVLARMPETTLCVAETRSDVVIAEEYGDPDHRDLEADAEASVQLRLKAHSNAAFMFKMFSGRFVEPRLLVDGDEKTRLFDYVEGDGLHRRVTLLRGDGGTGKTSVMLAVLSRILQQPPTERQETPIFVHCPWAEGLLTDEGPALRPLSPEAPECRVGPIVHALCAALAIRSAAELALLQKQRITVLLDSLDECPTSRTRSPGELLCEEPLLPRGGVTAEHWPNVRFVICCRKEFLLMYNITPQMLDRDHVTVCDIQPFTPEEQAQYVTKLVAQEVGLLAGRLAKAEGAREPLGEMRCVPCTEEAAAALRAAGAEAQRAAQRAKRAKDELKDEAEAAADAAKEALAEARRAVEEQCADGVRGVLRSLPADLLAIPFVLFLACSASRELVLTDLRIAPRYKVYAAWVHLDGANRIARVPELGSVMPDAPDRADRLMDAASTLAVGMYSQGLWQSTVGECVRMLGGGAFARAVLSVLPLRMESAKRDECRVNWRHRTVQEFAIARAVLLPGRTSAAVWACALGDRLSDSPEAQAFIAEGWQTLTAEEAAALRISLRMAASEMQSAHSVAQLSGTGLQEQQQQPSGAGDGAPREAEDVGQTPAELSRLRGQGSAPAADGAVHASGDAGSPAAASAAGVVPPLGVAPEVSEWIRREGLHEIVSRALAAVLATRPADPLMRLACYLTQPPPAPPPAVAHAEPAVAYLRRMAVPSATAEALRAVAAERPPSPARALAHRLAEHHRAAD